MSVKTRLATLESRQRANESAAFYGDAKTELARRLDETALRMKQAGIQPDSTPCTVEEITAKLHERCAAYKAEWGDLMKGHK